jgi:hypothetical protein
LIGAATPSPIVLLPPPAIVAAVAAPLVIIAPPACALVIAPPAFAFVHIGLGFFAHGFIAGRAFGVREGRAVVRGERIAADAVERHAGFRGWSLERGHEAIGAFGHRRAWRGREFAGRRADWRGGGWREARQGGGGWRRAWR